MFGLAPRNRQPSLQPRLLSQRKKRSTLRRSLRRNRPMARGARTAALRRRDVRLGRSRGSAGWEAEFDADDPDDTAIVDEQSLADDTTADADTADFSGAQRDRRRGQTTARTQTASCAARRRRGSREGREPAAPLRSPGKLSEPNRSPTKAEAAIGIAQPARRGRSTSRPWKRRRSGMVERRGSREERIGKSALGSGRHRFHQLECAVVAGIDRLALPARSLNRPIADVLPWQTPSSICGA